MFKIYEKFKENKSIAIATIVGIMMAILIVVIPILKINTKPKLSTVQMRALTFSIIELVECNSKCDEIHTYFEIIDGVIISDPNCKNVEEASVAIKCLENCLIEFMARGEKEGWTDFMLLKMPGLRSYMVDTNCPNFQQ